MNIDASRIEGTFKSGWSESGSKESENTAMSGKNYSRDPKPDNPQGRWPANLLLGCLCASDTHEPSCAVAMLDEQSGHLAGAGNKVGSKKKAGSHFSTGVAAFRLGFKFIGCEMNEEYCEIAKKRIEHAAKDSAS